MPKEPLYPHVPKRGQPLFSHTKPDTQKMKFIETRNLEGGLDRAVQFFDDQNKPLAEVSFGDVGKEGIVIQEVKALGKQLTQSDFRKIIGSVEELAVQNKRPVVWVQSRAKDNWIYQRLGYTFDNATGTYVKNVLGGKVPTMKAEDVMFRIAGKSSAIPKVQAGKLPQTFEGEPRNVRRLTKEELIEAILKEIHRDDPRALKQALRKDSYEFRQFMGMARGDLEWISAKGPSEKQLPQTIEGGEPIPPQYRDLIGLVSEPLPKEAA